jgi:hypothetical protein
LTIGDSFDFGSLETILLSSRAGPSGMGDGCVLVLGGKSVPGCLVER